MADQSPGKRFRTLLSRKEILVALCVSSPLEARIAVQAGFDSVAIGGFALGAHLASTEPLLTLTELADTTRSLAAAVSVPILVDVGTGFGESIHIRRTIREIERAGGAAVHIEDQFFPKRAHYHKGIE